MKTKFLTGLAIAASILIFNGCKKEGPMGPAGPAGSSGTNGANGINGTNGTNGTNGANGNANVETGLYTISNWVLNSSNAYNAQVSVPTITQHIVDKGAVLVYLQVGTGWIALPVTIYPYGTSGIAQTILCAHSLGSISISQVDSDGTPPNPNPGTIVLKVVAIDGNRWANFPKDIVNDYQAVKEYLHLIY